MTVFIYKKQIKQENTGSVKQALVDEGTLIHSVPVNMIMWRNSAAVWIRNSAGFATAVTESNQYQQASWNVQYKK